MEYTWLLIAVIVVVLVVMIYKAQDLLFIFMMFKKYLPIALVFGLIVLLVFSIFHVNKNYDTDYSSLGGLANTAKIYGIWAKDFAVKVARVTGNAINQDWFSDSSVNPNLSNNKEDYEKDNVNDREERRARR